MHKKLWISIALALFSTSPVIWFSHLPLIDYPNHLAALQIHKALGSNLYLDRFYEFRWKLTPYLGLDLLAIPFLSSFDVEITGRIVIILTFLLICLGTILLNRQLNPNNWGPSIFTGIFLYNGAFDWGWINYVIGIGVGIIAFWAWVRFREISSRISLVLFTLTAGIVCLMHFFAFIIYGICVAVYECSVIIEKLRVERRLRISLFRIPIRGAVSLVVPSLLALSLTPSNHGPTVWGRSWGPQSFWESFVKWKGEAFASPLYFHHFSEKPLVLAMLAIVTWALASRTFVVHSRMLLPLAALGLIVMVMPSELLGWFGADYRLPSAAVFFAWASLGWGESSRSRIKVVCLLLASCLIVRVGSVFLTWQRAQPIIEEYQTAMRLVPPGSRLAFRRDESAWGNPPLVHVPLLAAAKQGVLVPGGLFADNQLLKERNPVPSSLEDFDYLLEIGDPHVKIPTGISLKEIERGQTFALYRINRGPAE